MKFEDLAGEEIIRKANQWLYTALGEQHLPAVFEQKLMMAYRSTKDVLNSLEEIKNEGMENLL